MIHMTDTNNKDTENVTLTNVQRAFNTLFLAKSNDPKPIQKNHISLINDSELGLEIYQRTIILQDYGNFSDDGPGGPGEILRIRVKKGSLFPILKEVVDLLDGYEVKKLVKILKSLPKPKQV